MRLLIYDSKPRPGLLDEAWKVGAWVARRSGYFDAQYGADCWENALRWAAYRAELSRESIEALHIWGHGAPGAMWLGESRLSVDKLLNPTELLSCIKHIGSYLHEDALLWLRTCAAFNGSHGQLFARELADRLYCRVAGHTYNIGFPWHSGLHVLLPGQTPRWSAVEGQGSDQKPRTSGFSAPNTLFFARQRLP